MMLISTAGAAGLGRQRAVNCCLWASETFPASGGALLAPAALRDGQPAGRGSHPCHRGAREGASKSDGLFAEQEVGSRQVCGRNPQLEAGLTPSS